uniref:PDZ domain-containing protein n=1 Tax=Esox lucius TaxID=8010 RepID=A0A3P8ZXP6_ESOLU
MKVTVTFGRTGVVVPCKDGWTVRDLIQQATQRYRKLLEQEGDFLVRTHHVEYCDGGILDPDDTLSDLLEDRDKLMAVYEEQEAQQRGTVSPGGAEGIGRPSPNQDPYESELSVFQPIRGGEIEVNSSTLKSNTPLLVRSSSDSALSPPLETPHHGLPQDPPCRPRAPPMGVEHGQGVEHGHGVEHGLGLDHTAEPTEDVSKLNSTSLSLTKTVEISGEHGPLGIHVVPYVSSLSGRALGLHIRGVEENSRSKREGIFQDDECIVKINETELMDKSFTQSQEVFRQAMRSPVVRLEVVPVFNRERYEKSLIGQLFNHSDSPKALSKTTPKEPPPVKVKPTFKPTDSSAPRLGEDSSNLEGRLLGSTQPVPVSLSPVSKVKSDSPLPKGPSHPTMMGFAGKKGGKKLKIDLKKGPEGLGFTVVTRDSSVHGPGPILVKNILPRGAAVKDGRLQSGDRILEVNGVDMAGRSQEELVAMLRSTRQGDPVVLLVCRQEDMFLPRELKEEEARAVLLSEEGKEQLMFEVPLNDTGSAGLGISLKGNKSRETGEDLGIFIKSIIHGGAAYKDGRLRMNDQLIAVNGESLLGKSNHEAMETLRRSMSMEGNLRGMIQLVVLRALVQSQDAYISPNRSFDASAPASPVQPPVVNSISDRSSASNGGYHRVDEDEADEEVNLSVTRQECLSPAPVPGESSSRPDRLQLAQPQYHQHTKMSKSSKSMDLEPSPALDLGPTLGLKKSSSLESLQTAMLEMRKNDLLPFHRPRPHMVRGRGCNESFRAAIDKSYDGPAEDDDDDLSDQSSGRDTPASGSSRQGVGDAMEESKPKKDKKKKAKEKKKDKQKEKGKGKEKKDKRTEDVEEPDKKSKKIGFGLLRFGKKKDDKERKVEAKATLQRQKSEILSEEELERMKEERERIEAKHTELRGRQVRAPGSPDVEDDDTDPNYARISNFRDRTEHQSQYSRARTPSPQRPPPHGLGPSHASQPSSEDPLDGLYAKVNKQRQAPPPSSADSSSVDRVQQLRREYQLARRDGAAPPYHEIDPRRRGPEYDQHRMPVRGPGPDLRLVPRYEEVERQYASLPRRAPIDPSERYPGQLPGWGGHYPGPQPCYPNFPRQADPGYYHPPPTQPRGPLRQDVPPSPTLPPRAPRYDTMTGRTGGGGFRQASPERFTYGGDGAGRQADPRQKNPMTAAV